jgi:hypothetical protein
MRDRQSAVVAHAPLADVSSCASARPDDREATQPATASAASERTALRRFVPADQARAMLSKRRASIGSSLGCGNDAGFSYRLQRVGILSRSPRGAARDTNGACLTDDVFLHSDTWARWQLGIPLPVE